MIRSISIAFAVLVILIMGLTPLFLDSRVSQGVIMAAGILCVFCVAEIDKRSRQPQSSSTVMTLRILGAILAVLFMWWPDHNAAHPQLYNALSSACVAVIVAATIFGPPGRRPSKGGDKWAA